MSTNIGELYATIGVDITKLQEALKQAKKEMNSASDSIKKGSSQINESIKKAGQGAKVSTKNIKDGFSQAVEAQDQMRMSLIGLGKMMAVGGVIAVG